MIKNSREFSNFQINKSKGKIEITKVMETKIRLLKPYLV